jgi:hypothetical protein
MHHRHYLLLQNVPEKITFLTIHAGICNNVHMFKKQDKYNMTKVTTKNNLLSTRNTPLQYTCNQLTIKVYVLLNLVVSPQKKKKKTDSEMIN